MLLFDETISNLLVILASALVIIYLTVDSVSMQFYEDSILLLNVISLYGNPTFMTALLLTNT